MTGLNDAHVMKLLTELEGTLSKEVKFVVKTTNKGEMIMSLRALRKGVCGQRFQGQRRRSALFLGAGL